MGCDIHIHLEYKLKNNNGDFNSWTVSPLRIDANYEMFALMADVRNEDGFLERLEHDEIGRAHV